MHRPLRVLVVDDHPDSAEATAQLLALHGHDTRPAHSCAEALQLAPPFAPDLVVLDVCLPDGDGFALAADLCRVLPARPALVVVTGLPGQADRCRNEGFDHHFLKPAVPCELVAVVDGYAARLPPD
jgi:CheY-like chemotaxis protein